MASTVILGATSYDSLDSSWSERMKSTDEAPKPMSLTLLAQTTPEKFEVEAVVKVESDVKVEDVEGNDLIRAFGTLTVETKTEIPPEANGNNSAKDEDDNDLLRPPSPKRKSVVIIRSGTPERFRDEHLYLVARSWDSKYRIYHWNIRNQGSSFVSYVDPSDRLNDRSCVAWICEYGIQDFLIGPDLYRSNYQTSTLSKCEFGSKEFRPVDLWSDNLEQAMRYYQSLAPALHPDALVPHDPKGDCQLINLSDPDNPEDLWCHLMNMLNPQPPTETNGLRDVLENGIPGVATAMPSPGSSDEAFDASVLTPTSDDPQSSQKMILPEGKQTIAELEIFVKKVETKLKELSGKRRVECPKCGKSPCDSKYTTLMRHILPHYGHQPYACNTCPRRFTNEPNMRRHERDIHGEKRCNPCGADFTSHRKLLSHKQDVHKESIRPKGKGKGAKGAKAKNTLGDRKKRNGRTPSGSGGLPTAVRTGS